MKNRTKIILIVLASFVLLLAIGVFSWRCYVFNKIVTVITMDINPSVEISLNKKNEVVNVKALNDDGEKILDDVKFKGDSLEKVIDDISSKLIEQNYLAEEDNYILINVTGKDIKTEVSNLITTTLKNNNVECNVIIEEVTEEDKEKAKNYGISSSKLSYIEGIIEENEDISFEELKDKSIKEINAIIEEKK